MEVIEKVQLTRLVSVFRHTDGVQWVTLQETVTGLIGIPSLARRSRHCWTWEDTEFYNHSRCPVCTSEKLCRQLVHVYPNTSTLLIVHEYDGSND